MRKVLGCLDQAVKLSAGVRTFGYQEQEVEKRAAQLGGWRDNYLESAA